MRTTAARRNIRGEPHRAETTAVALWNARMCTGLQPQAKSEANRTGRRPPLWHSGMQECAQDCSQKQNQKRTAPSGDLRCGTLECKNVHRTAARSNIRGEPHRAETPAVALWNARMCTGLQPDADSEHACMFSYKIQATFGGDDRRPHVSTFWG